MHQQASFEIDPKVHFKNRIKVIILNEIDLHTASSEKCLLFGQALMELGMEIILGVMARAR